MWKDNLESFLSNIILIRTLVTKTFVKHFTGNEESAEMFKKINRAYEVLSDKDKR